MTGLYTKEFRAIMQSNADCSKLRTNRIEEIKNFAQSTNFKRIGIAHCISFSHEAKVLSDYLSKYFNVYSVDCKYGNLTKKELLGGESKRILCNPAGQADFLNNHKTELNISMGLCVGHDMIFSKLSEGLVTNLFDKDFTNKHNSLKAIKELEHYN
ncbi:MULTISPECIES: DUF1847 domain-containing protein [Marinilabiliaceae]|uniref:DUF1847 domain-containing protein n=1 Tax=Plebeiibacterium marinum TaxID=2992111 RepID=A0AAE3MF98_9BACT|nr:DUF1847 domain-containing protein [Plebeiobacterium marinum]MCU4164350.1 DUF1847 domain-containing protein [Marinilabiliaceae bacterium A049]MCW3806696.1 DUF1847 domain-containing protein [Plebeiobacterium marinum]